MIINNSALDGWFKMSDAPRNGTKIIAMCEGEECEVLWSECPSSPAMPPIPQMSGWVDSFNHYLMPELDCWKYIPDKPAKPKPSVRKTIDEVDIFMGF